MTKVLRLSSSPRTLRGVGVFVGIACTALTSTGCQGKNDTVSLPTPSQSRAEAHADSTQSPPAAEIEAARRAYQEFVAMLDRATSLPVATRKEQIMKYATEPQLSKVLEVAARHQANGIASYGHSIVHVKDVQVRNGEAVVRDCQDSSKAGLLDIAKQKKLNRGVKEENVRTTLKKGSDGHWRVSRYHVIGEGC